jgi:hypothetical protein
MKMTRLTIKGTSYEVKWHKELEDICCDCYEHDRTEEVGRVGNLVVYECYAHGDEAWVVRKHYDDGGYIEGTMGEFNEKCDYAEEE